MLFLKKTIKLASNALYGKLLENKRKRRLNTTFVSSEKLLRFHARSPLYSRAVDLGNDKFLVMKNKSKVFLDTPIYVGMVILQLSKYKVWDFYYNVLKKEFGDRVKLLYTDTDSLLVKITVGKGTKLQELLDNTILKDYIDRSNMGTLVEKDEKFNGNTDCLKSETGDDIIRSAVLVKPKLYSIETEKSRKVAVKGVNMRNIEDVVHSQFKNILKKPSEKVKRLQTQIRKKKTSMYTVRLTKTVLSAYENKRFWVNAYESYAFGHPDIQHLSGANDCTPLRFERSDVCTLPSTCKIIAGGNDDYDDLEELASDTDIDGIDTDCIDNPVVDETLCISAGKGINRKLE